LALVKSANASAIGLKIGQQSHGYSKALADEEADGFASSPMVETAAH
jgi:hypothetical protein